VPNPDELQGYAPILQLTPSLSFTATAAPLGAKAIDEQVPEGNVAGLENFEPNPELLQA
jgi:hypothetical protein